MNLKKFINSTFITVKSRKWPSFMLSTLKGGREIAIRPLILALDSLFEMHVLYCANFEANEVNPDLLKKVA